MKRQFVLIDQSIKAPGGHHYEYAQRILDAARDTGYETLLLAHKDYRGNVDHNVIGAFSQTFWDNHRFYYSSGITHTELKSRFFPNSGLLYLVIENINDIRLNIKRRIRSSSFSIAFARARNYSFRDIFLRPHLVDDFSYQHSSRLLLVISRLIIKIAPHIINAQTLMSRYWPKRILFFLLVILASPILVLIWLVLLARRRDPAEWFARELTSVLKLECSSDDILFVPNATPAETEGLIALCRTGHSAANANWAFLYRRPLFSGFSGAHNEQLDAARVHRLEFARVRAFAPKAKVNFYTDTDELTEQYNLLGVFRFATLPVPVVPQPCGPTNRDSTLTIGYLGDARDEKGFQYLPEVVRDFAGRNQCSRSVRFCLQANFNVAEGEPGSRYARSLLEQYGADVVDLPEGPFDSIEYGRLLNSMDIVLIPYSAESYRARSSGVLMEAVSVGTPVLVPTCSWMAGLLESTRREHILSLVRDREPIASVKMPFDEISDRTLLVDEEADYVFFRLKCDVSFNGYVRITMCSINEFDIGLETAGMAFRAIDGEVVALFPKPRSSKLWWKAENLGSGVNARLVEAEVNLYSSGGTLPLGAGAAFFDRVEDIPRATKELVDFYVHHKNGANQLRERLRPQYEPAALVERIENDAAANLASQSAVRRKAVS
ncbi:MAG: hypothetical protein NXI27_06630 [Alphaproteobacteria bacterium]|nr:hypothetical protein [Alphaproteobacteria bacterium]